MSPRSVYCKENTQKSQTFQRGIARKPWTNEMTGESMTVTGTEVREEVAKVWPTTAKAVIGQSATTGTLFLPRKSRAVAMTAERVERTGEEVERETERWQSTRLVKSSAQPSGEETMVVWILTS